MRDPSQDPERRPWLCRLGFHNSRMIAHCGLPDFNDPEQECQTCSPLYECVRCHATRTWGDWVMPNAK